MRYSLHEIDTHDVVATTVAADRDEALEWFSEKLRLSGHNANGSLCRLMTHWKFACGSCSRPEELTEEVVSSHFPRSDPHVRFWGVRRTLPVMAQLMSL
jgi:hypothetical protein